jgi:hypothetical protein
MRCKNPQKLEAIMKKVIVGFIFLALGMAYADFEPVPFEIDIDLLQAPIPGYTNWCFVNFEKDHWDHNETQTPTHWSNVMIEIPVGATAAQLTGRPPRKCMCNEGHEMALIPELPTIAGKFLKIPVQYWGDPWKLFIGWKIDGTTKRGRVSHCKTVVVHPY